MTFAEWWRSVTDPTYDPALDKGRVQTAPELVAGVSRLDAQDRMARIAPPVLPTSPYADLAAARIRIECLERDVAELEHELAREMDARKEADQAVFDECVAHGESRRELIRDLRVMQEQRDAARVAETMCSVSRCPRCQTDVGCLPVGWWCDECTRAYPGDARAFGYRAIAERIDGLSGLDFRADFGDAYVDPADTAKVGDQLGMRWVDENAAHTTCRADTGFVVCTRAVHHKGQHVATAGGQVLDVWPTEPADDRRPCANCTDRVHTLSARDWCDSCEGQDADELVEKARALGDEVGQRIVTGAEARDLPYGAVLLRVDDLGPETDVVVKIQGGWWSFESRAAEPLAPDLRFAVLYVPGTVETREVRPVAGRDRTAAIEGAAITLRAHAKHVLHSGCSCGWERESSSYYNHVAEQLAAVGALGNLGLSVNGSAPVLVDGDGDEWLPLADGRYVLFEGGVDVRSRPEVESTCGPVTVKAGA